MRLQAVAGFNVIYANFRKKLKTFYYTRKFEGENFATLLLIQDGKCHFEFDRGRTVAEAGTFLCYEAKALRRAWADPRQPPSYYIIAFDLINRLGGLVSPSEAGIPLVLRLENPVRPKAFAEKMVREWGVKRRNYRLRCSVYGLQMLEALEEFLLPARGNLLKGWGEREDERMHGILEFIRRNYKVKLSVSALARKAALQPAAFFKVFKKATGMTPRQYVLNRRIEQAKEDLLMENLSLATTSEELGFCDYSNFHRTFKKMTGLAPSEYAQKTRERPTEAPPAAR